MYNLIGICRLDSNISTLWLAKSWMSSQEELSVS